MQVGPMVTILHFSAGWRTEVKIIRTSDKRVGKGDWAWRLEMMHFLTLGR